MRRQEPELTDEDLERLARLGGAADQIAEAAGLDVAQVRRRLTEEPHPGPSEGRVPAQLGGVLSR